MRKGYMMKNFLLKSDYVGNKGFLEKIALGDIFEHLSVYEDKFDKDYTEFSFEQAEQFVEDYITKTKTSKKLVKEALSKYCVWYREQKMYSGGLEVDDDVNENKLEQNNKNGEERGETVIKNELEDWLIPESETTKRKNNRQKIFNPDRYISENELNDYCEKVPFLFDTLLLRSIYEGFDFSEEAYDIARIKIGDCDPDKNLVRFPESGKIVKVSPELMHLMLKCANSLLEETNDNSALLGQKIANKITEADEDRCFKMLILTEGDKNKENDKLLLAVRNRIKRIKKDLGINKITSTNLYCSGYLTGLQKTGLYSGWDSLTYINTPERKSLLKRYKMDHMLHNNYTRKINVYLKEAE